MAKVTPDTATVRACPALARSGAAWCPQATMTPAALAGHYLCQVPQRSGDLYGQRRQEHV